MRHDEQVDHPSPQRLLTVVLPRLSSNAFIRGIELIVDIGLAASLGHVIAIRKLHIREDARIDANRRAAATGVVEHDVAAFVQQAGGWVRDQGVRDQGVRDGSPAARLLLLVAADEEGAARGERPPAA